MSQLFTAFRLGELELPNRIVIAPMCQYSAEDGCASDWHLMHLGQLAISGAGLLILEATAVEPAGRITPQDLGLWSDANEAALRRVLAAVRRHAPIPIGVQLSHAGRKASSRAPWEGGSLLRPDEGGWDCVAPSAVPHGDAEPPPHALDAAGLQRIRQAFVDAAKRAVRLGLDLIELHAAHGYLLHQFLSPLSNRRDDAYGGSLENRMRFVLEVFDAVRAAVPARVPVGVRLSATDWVDNGWDPAQSAALCAALEPRGCAYAHVSSGGLSPRQAITVGPGYQVGFAESIRRHVSMPVIAVGLITEAEQAEAIVADGRADLVALARAMLYDPRWPWHAAARLGAQVTAPPQYWRCQPSAHKALFGSTRVGQR
ncbi:NADPH dehydrogenase [Thiomonas sp. X19]|uniref:NADH:flavin oxidoreductase/NADH oxidase n=1 Tax=Thiomonas sp. X19 TaxID=1050370 RepID=UPI000B70F432|nr:NADH:flavin oxidoreductase/NADH oxidase [Thiomonas sp. X19]SCC95805.1 NADPH dehydrogenase [Thiomonas sp. X19]